MKQRVAIATACVLGLGLLVGLGSSVYEAYIKDPDDHVRESIAGWATTNADCLESLGTIALNSYASYEFRQLQIEQSPCVGAVLSPVFVSLSVSRWEDDSRLSSEVRVCAKAIASEGEEAISHAIGYAIVGDIDRLLASEEHLVMLAACRT